MLKHEEEEKTLEKEKKRKKKEFYWNLFLFILKLNFYNLRNGVEFN